MRSAIQSRQKEWGQSTVELALAATLLMTLLAGTVEIGRALFTWLAMRDAAQEGAYYGSISPPSTTLTCDASTPPPTRYMQAGMGQPEASCNQPIKQNCGNHQFSRWTLSARGNHLSERRLPQF